MILDYTHLFYHYIIELTRIAHFIPPYAHLVNDLKRAS
nr:MAG TPA: hypothetical protein [Caudoviricetes sp.]